LPPGEYEFLIGYASRLRDVVPDADWAGFDPIAVRTVTLEDESIDLGMLGPDPRATIDGRIVVEGEGGRGFDLTTLPEFRFNQWHTYATSLTVATSEPDGRFIVDSVFPTRYKLSYNGLRPLTNRLPDGWFVKSIRSAGQDVLNHGLTVSGGATLPLEIVLSSEGARLDGVVRLANDELAGRALVVLVPPPVTRGMATHLRAALSDDGGRYEIRDVPPGDYRVLALDLAGRGTTILFWQDPAFLREHDFRGQPVRVDPGGARSIDLRAVPISN
jgi:hypothetical protein